MIYLDSSALVKLGWEEKESPALRQHLARLRDPVKLTSVLSKVEVIRAMRLHGEVFVANARAVLESLEFLPLDDTILGEASNLDPSRIRTLDAIHLASALSMGEAVQHFLTYDAVMLDAALELGLPAASPV